MTSFLRIALVLLLLVLMPAGVRADGSNDELDQNRRLLEKWQNENPERYARLRQELRAFRSLAPERQEQLRALDRQLHREDSATSTRLHRTLEHYTEWLQSLPEAERQKVETAADAGERLQHIKEIRQRQWIERLPRAYQDKLSTLESNPSRYQEQLRIYRQEERQRREDWRYAIRHWDVLEKRRQQLARVHQFAPEIKTFVQESLSPLLSSEEKTRLKNTQPPPEGQGDWTVFLTMLVELADRHPIRFPPSSTIGPVSFDELPADLQVRLKAVKGWPTQAAKLTQGKWPDYATEVLRVAAENQFPRRPLPGPSRLEQYAPSVQKFCKEKLFPALSPEQMARVRRAEGRWPGYPRLLLNLARDKNLQMPGMKLPGPPDLWQPFRSLSRDRSDGLSSGPLTPSHSALSTDRPPH